MRGRRLARGVALAAALAAAAPARAADYGYFVDVETEDQLLDLLSSQEIDQSTFDALQDLLNDGVDLNTADREELYALPNLTYDEVDRILLYRSQAGRIDDPTVLVTGGILTERKLLAIAAYLVASDGQRRVDLRGRIRLRSLYVAGDKEAPPMFLSARAATLKKKLDFAVVVALTRNELTDVRWDPNRDALSALPPSLKVRVPKFYAQYKTEHWHLIAGTFRIGFGQRLTLDNTNRYNPNGIRPDDQVYNSRDLTAACHQSAGEPFGVVCPDSPAGLKYESPDFKWPTRFRGLAIGFHSNETPRGWAQVYGFGSFETKGIYQYELFDRVKCSDPRSDDPDCAAPAVYVRQADPLTPSPRFSYSTLPEMYNEVTAGGNFSWFFNRRAHVGVTGYGSSVYWLTDGARLDFQEWSRTPWGGAFGAIGVDAAVGVRSFDLGAEISRSFDNQPEGGSWAAILRGTLTFKKQELEFTGRYFDPNYNNPYARPIAAVDEFEGLRAANEGGFRVRHIGTFGDLELRSLLDIWGDILKQRPEIRFRTRAEYEVATWFRPSVWLDVMDKNLLVNGNGQCFLADVGEGEPGDCSGMRTQMGVQLKFLSRKGLTVALRYLHKLIDDPHYPTSFRQDMSAWLSIMYSPTDWLRLRLRLRYLSEDIENKMAGEESIWAYLESVFQIRRKAFIKLRYEVYAWIDQRDSTQLRDPNPAHWLRLELEYRF